VSTNPWGSKKTEVTFTGENAPDSILDFRGPTSKRCRRGRRERKGREGTPTGWLTPHVPNLGKYPVGN